MDVLTGDIISDLPSNILDKILICLPIKDVARTSILSKKWRFKWLYISQLVFNENDLFKLYQSPIHVWLKIYQVLALHRGPLQKFVLPISPYMESEIFLIDQIILILSGKDIQNLTLAFPRKEPCYKLVSTLFHCVNLRHLSLADCAIKPPPEFTRFSSLISIEFLRVKLSDNDFITLISKCPFLQRLTLTGVYGGRSPSPSTSFHCVHLTHLNLSACVIIPPPEFIGFSKLITVEFEVVDLEANDFVTFISKCPLLQHLTLKNVYGRLPLEVDALNLKFCYFDCVSRSIIFRNVPVLSTVIIKNSNTVLEHFSNCSKVFGSLPAIEYFYAGPTFVTFLSRGVIPKSLPIMLNHLKSIELCELDLNCLKHVQCALLLLKHSPNLQKLNIKLGEDAFYAGEKHEIVIPLFKNQSLSEYSFNHLQEASLELQYWTATESEFLKFLLAGSLVLKMVTILPPKGISSVKGSKSNFITDVTRFPRASPEAKIIFLWRV